MSQRLLTLRRTLAVLLTALAVGVVGVGTISTETARAAGVVVEHRSWGANPATY